MRHEKKQENTASTPEKKQSIETVLEEAQTVDLQHKIFSQLLKGPKETMPRELNESVRMMSHQRENIN